MGLFGLGLINGGGPLVDLGLELPTEEGLTRLIGDGGWVTVSLSKSGGGCCCCCCWVVEDGGMLLSSSNDDKADCIVESISLTSLCV